MRKGLLLFLTWLAGTAVATTFAWGAVSVVRRNVTERRVASLSPRAVSDALDTTPETLASTTTTGPTADSTPTTGGSDTPPVTVTSTAGRSTPTTKPARGSAGGSTGGGTTGGATAGGSPSGGTQTGSGGSTPANTKPPTTTTTTSPFTGERVADDCGFAGRNPPCSGSSGGNQVDLRCQGSTISYGWIRPASGWQVDGVTNTGTQLRVDFRPANGSKEHMDAHCDANGQPTWTFHT